MGKLYNVLETITDEINKMPYGLSFDNLDDMYITGKIDKIFKDNNVDYLFKNEVIKFLGILYSSSMTKQPSMSKIKLHESELVTVFNRFGYILSLYIGSKDAYDVLPLFLYQCIKKFDLNGYKNITIESLFEKLAKCMDIDAAYNLNTKRYLVRVVNHIAEGYTNYSSYDEKIELKQLNKDDKTEFFVGSESWTYRDECLELEKMGINPYNYVKWVARENGDGYGYDVLSYDPINEKEKLIEVKSGTNYGVDLTKQEFRTMHNIKKSSNADYYIYKYINVGDDIDIEKYKYDPNTETLINLKNGCTYYTSPYFYYEDGVQKIGFELVEEKEFKKMLQK